MKFHGNRNTGSLITKREIIMTNALICDTPNKKMKILHNSNNSTYDA